jgi:hypothetical protein
MLAQGSVAAQAPSAAIDGRSQPVHNRVGSTLNRLVLHWASSPGPARRDPGDSLMRTHRRTGLFSAAALALVVVFPLTAFSSDQGSTSAAGAPAAESCGDVQDPPAQLPPGVEDGDLLFVNTFHPVLVQLTCGRVELVELTGWDSCYFLHRKTITRYPC